MINYTKHSTVAICRTWLYGCYAD